jgi:hypothetical protein
MKDRGIFDGDVVVVEHNTLPRPGEVVVAVVDGETTVKTLGLNNNEMCSSLPTRRSKRFGLAYRWKCSASWWGASSE